MNAWNIWRRSLVATRWLRVSPKRDDAGQPLAPTESQINMLLNNSERIAEIRIRLSDVSWWMRSFSMHMSVRANKEDQVRGHFWESRFGSEVLESEASVLTLSLIHI